MHHTNLIRVIATLALTSTAALHADPIAGRTNGGGGTVSDPRSSPNDQPEYMAPALTSCSQPTTRYRLIEGSTLTDDCTICGRPSIMIPIRGRFWLRPMGPDPLFSNFVINNLTFYSLGPNPEYKGEAQGTYRLGGEVALLQQMMLVGRINEFDKLDLDSGLVPPQAAFPWIEIDLTQVSPADPLHTFSLHLVAVPWPTLWFSTEVGFHPSSGPAYASDGDLLSFTGQVVRTNAQLTSRLGIMPMVPDLGLDAAMVRLPLPWQAGPAPREVCFSLEDDVFSETLGPLGQGDLLSEAGAIVRRNADLIAPFSPEPGPHDYGLDTVACGPDGLLLFSAEESFFSERLGVTIDHGDLLSEDGKIVKTNSQLMAGFQPVEPVPASFGLDAVYVWPHGEVWFSTEVGFLDRRWGPIGEGDLLSNTGRVVCRNLELLAPFGPLEDLADFGLDALEVIWPAAPSDLDADGDVDGSDFLTFANCYNGSYRAPLAGCENPGADIDGDADTDGFDFLSFSNCYNGSNRLPRCP